MKKIVNLVIFFLVSAAVFGQESLVIVNGGYSFAKVEDTGVRIEGWRINGTYEFNPFGQKWDYGISVGYLKLKGSNETRDYSISSIPVCFAPKYTSGSNKLKGFIKGAFGAQFSNLETTGSSSDLSDHDYGFVIGGGAGFMLFFNEKFFFNAEYEIMWMSNSFYSDGWVNTVSGGLGIKF